MKPIIKWAGGKYSISKDLEQFLPQDIIETKNINKYYEPFFGGGGFLFYLLTNNYNIGEIHISDLNYQVYNLYRIIKENFEEFNKKLDYLIYKFHQEDDKKTFFLNIRINFNRSDKTDVDSAVYFLFLNKTCFNGLYRENKKGEFNVPFGKYKKYSFYDENNLREIKSVLDRSYIYNINYKDITEINEDTFLYLDPPYIPLSKTSSFTSYTSKGFGSKEQYDLLKFLYHINDNNGRFILSNSYSEDSLDLYKDFNINTIEAKRSINSDKNGRKKIKEAVVKNYG